MKRWRTNVSSPFAAEQSRCGHRISIRCGSHRDSPDGNPVLIVLHGPRSRGRWRSRNASGHDIAWQVDAICYSSGAASRLCLDSRGTTQTLSVSTISAGKEVAGAQSKLVNDKGIWFVTAPRTVSVHRSYHALNVTCTGAGYAPGVVTSASSTKGIAFGNILLGGLIGAAVGMSDGAAYDYPTLITVPLAASAPSTAPGKVAAPSGGAAATS